MAVLLTRTMGQLDQRHKPLYSLFEKSSKAVKPEHKALTSVEHSVVTPATKKAGLTGNKKAKKDPKDVSNPPSSSKSSVAPPPNTSELLEVDPNEGRRKRQKTVSPKDKDFLVKGKQEPQSPLSRREMRKRKSSSSNTTQLIPGPETLDGEAVNENDGVALENSALGQNGEPIRTVAEESGISTKRRSRSRSRDEGSAVLPVAPMHSAKVEDMTKTPPKPKKILQFNPKTGTIGSPPAKKEAAPTDTKPRSKPKSKTPKSKVVVLRYGSERGVQIDEIFAGTRTIPPKKKLEEKSKTSMSVKPPAVLHPFFSGNPAMKATEIVEVENAVGPSEPRGSVSLGRATMEGRPLAPSKSKPSAFLGFGSSTKLVKFPGAIEPAWPWKEMVHVHGHENIRTTSRGLAIMPVGTEIKKSKYQSIQILDAEDVVGTFAADICIERELESLQEIHLDEYPQIPTCLRTPIQHFESGYRLQKRIKKELQSRPLQMPPKATELSSEDEIRGSHPLSRAVHPAISKAYTSIATSLSAFDQFQCETQPWTQKFSPKSAAEVLQSGREAIILKEWLEKLTLVAVETKLFDRPGIPKPDSSKRKRKSKKLDGFVVSSDEEDNDMDEITDLEDEAPPSSQGLQQQKSLLRINKDSSKVGNAVLISGPHGCGKTAAVYAVAKELGFEVFEINSSSRRSGKDILEKVGDMTRNHLVQQSHTQKLAEELDEDAQRISDALADDIKTGRQGTMNSFFKREDPVKVKSRPEPKEEKSKSGTVKDAPQQATLGSKAPPKKQKQSLILLEEVDILYEEDKQFWATVVNLIAQSKRPVIMTCTNETVIPPLTDLHGVLRFKAPPVDIATDYVLSIAAIAGHALERSAVKSLYQSRNLDLRASLTELNFWCQFAVGDLKGGLNWVLPRWPLGCDFDKDGNTIRVISENTYQTGMGWLSQDVLESQAHYLDIEEETVREAWDGWQLDPGNWQETISLGKWAEKTTSLSTAKADRLALLNMYDDFTDTMSIADLCSGTTFAAQNEVLLDTSIPLISDKVRNDYTMDYAIIEAVPLVDYVNTGSKVAYWMKSRARKYLQEDQHIKHGFEIPTELDRPCESRVISLIEDQITSPDFQLTRRDLSAAFDAISESEKGIQYLSGQVEASVFDGTKTVITTDIAPYVRSIVAYDAKLQEQRLQMGNLLSEGGKPKRLRTTRAAISALEGGTRSTTRREKYFGDAKLNPYLVFKTGMPAWLEAVPAATVVPSQAMNGRLITGSDTSRMTDGATDLEDDEA